ncbi:serine protease, S1-C subfamily, contains C-terminal PDZ domain [Paenibacillus uliginis N3/975]|uniref:Serine protease, S1-C subfamily, contains C-terminal PDZ domain n=1 Tax=Paenibacillus uliginis N3/975 TaxID=1313296 RepID=A0A1X7HTQ6_9BACL|nr:trypsin-like peptidase domain-containing protein [Paenibacillus uliginis]SMF92872.1 serine protease, S1-C subfamily, contains C-terminal PDZ domain [Paenibacillus uliginis N3/975]
MGLFKDDFYSTKVSRRSKKTSEDRPGRVKWRSSRRRRSLSTFQISAISSVCSALIAVLLFSLLTGHPSTSSRIAIMNGQPIAQTEGDPYERLVNAAAKVRPAVVSVVTHKDPKPITSEEQDSSELEEGIIPEEGDMPEELPEDFDLGEDFDFDFGDDFGGGLDESKLGSGVIFKKIEGKAYVITNNHVIEGADSLEVVTVKGDTKEATLVGTDRVSDLAVLSIDSKGIGEVAELGDSSKLRLGEMVFAIGNPLGLGDTLTSGIISYTNRVIPVSLNQDGVFDWEAEVIQTDAAINEGNSGGALVDLNGKVIGINTMKIADKGVEGLGFAIPTNDVTEIVKELMLNGKIARPYLGVYTIDLSNPYVPMSKQEMKDLKLPKTVTEGVIVLDALGPAKEAGLKLNDVITKFNGKPIHTTLDLRKFLYKQTKIGDDLNVTFYRGGKEQSLKVPLEEKPGE